MHAAKEILENLYLKPKVSPFLPCIWPPQFDGSWMPEREVCGGEAAFPPGHPLAGGMMQRQFQMPNEQSGVEARALLFCPEKGKRRCVAFRGWI
jgi:hypothetical protein